MNPDIMSSMNLCAFGDWVGIAVLVAVGLFSLVFLVLGSALLAKSLFAGLLDGARRKDTGAA